MSLPPNQSPGANRRWRGQFRYRGSRRESAVAQLWSLGHSRMADYIQFAKQFGDIIAREDYVAAREFLTREAQADWSAQEMQKWSERMRLSAPGPFTNVMVMEDHILKDWPFKRDGDVASIYISLEGDDFVQAVSVIVSEQDGELRIRDLEWGRP